MIGINLGSGKWSCENWIGLDKLQNEYLNEKTVLPYNDNSIDYIYSSHFFEHINDETAINLLQESKRVLKKGGIIRIIVPDYELLQKKYCENNSDFFLNIVGFKGRPEWKKYNVEYSLENILTHWFSNYNEGDPDNHNGYRGPPRILSKDDIKKNAHKLSTEEFSKWCISHIPINNKNVSTEHINCFTEKKLNNIFKKLNFTEYKKSTHMKSKIPDIYKYNKFDNLKDRSTMSLYYEAIK